ncbi:MAG: MFS transporter [Desulfovibrio sp.]|nr:MFS transporter [Desulfovibrio sp.]
MDKGKGTSLLSRDFVSLFLLAMCNNCNIAVYYCFEQWLDGHAVSPNWRGWLLAVFFAIIFVCRQAVSGFLLNRDKRPAMVISIAVTSIVMLFYPLVPHESIVVSVLALRIVQGVAIAVYSFCTTALLVDCIPEGQSARGFAVFSLTLLLPYSIIPAAAERILPLLGGEANLFAWTSLLGIPALLLIVPLMPRLKRKTAPLHEKEKAAASLRQGIFHSGLALIYLACMLFGIMTSGAILFMKGLCALTGAHTEHFFVTYTCTIMAVRITIGHLFDRLPRFSISVICCTLLCGSMLTLAYGPAWGLIPVSLCYGGLLGVFYPLLAAAVYDRSTPQTRPINANIMMAAFDISGLFSPLLGGLVIHCGFGYRGVFVGFACVIALCGLCILLDRLRNSISPPLSCRISR